MQMEMGVNVRVLVVMRRHVEHLQSGGRVGCHGRHPLRVKTLSSEPLCIAQLRAKLRSGQGHPLPLQVVQPRVEGRKMVGRPRYVGKGDCSVPSKVLHGVGRGVQGLQVRRLHLKSRLHPFAELPLSEVPQLTFSEARFGAVQTRHVVSQQRIAGAQRHVERVVAVGRRHDVGPCVFTEGAQGGSVGADVGLNSRHGGGWLFEGRTPDR